MVVNTMLMAFAGFSLVLLVWVLWGYNMGFGPGAPRATGSFWSGLVGHPHPIVSHFGEQNQASRVQIPIPFHFPTSTLAYFQSCSPITPLLFLGSVLGR